MPKYFSTKTYGTDRGLSCCFRQWRATHSHCQLLHGYSIGVKLIFECDELDVRNWVYDFGGLKEFKGWLEYMFDHTTLIAKDDPHLENFRQLSRMGRNVMGAQQGHGILELREVDGVGCEKFAEMIYNKMDAIIKKSIYNCVALNPTVRIKSVEVFEHGANSAIYEA